MHAITRYDSHQSRAQLTTRAGIFRRLISADNPMDICRMDIAQLQTFADNRHLNFDVAQAFAALSPDTTYRPVGNMEHIEPATPAEIAWASAHVRPLTSPDPLVGELSPLEDRWVRAARTLGVFTPTLLYQHACGSTRDIKPMIQRMLDAGIIAQVQQAKRFVCPAVYRWIGDGSPPTLDTTLLDPPDAETTEERWRNAARTLGVFTQDALRELAMSSKDWIKPMLGLMLSSGEIIQIQARKRGRHGQPALYQWIGGSGSPPPTCR